MSENDDWLGGGALMSRKKENYAYGSLKERLVIITVRQVLP